MDSAIWFILILIELLRIQYNFLLTLKGAVSISWFIYNIVSCQLSHPIYPDTQVTQDTVQLYADTQRSCEDRVDSYTISLHIDSAIQFILILNELLRIQYNFMLTLKRSCEGRVDSYTILLHVNSAIQFILILNELLRIQFNFMLTPKGAVRIELILLCFCFFYDFL